MGVVHNLILGGGGASLPTTLNVTVSGGTATSVTASLGSRSVPLAYDSTSALWSATLPKNATGNWTVTATDGSKTVSDLMAISGPGIWSIGLSLGILPSEYTQLESLSSTGTQYIDTGLSGNFQSRLVCTFSIETWGNRDGYNCVPIFGAGRDSYQDGDYGMIFMRPSDAGWWAGTPQRTRYLTPPTPILNTKYDVDYNNIAKTLTVDGQNLTPALESYNQATSASRHLFAIYFTNESGVKYLAGITFYDVVDLYTSIGGEHHYYPAKCNDTVIAYKGTTQTTAIAGTLGMYDLVDNKFYINSGSGSFTAGPEV